MENSVPVRSVKKALDLLDEILMADLAGGCVSLGDLAGRLGIPNNSAHNLLKTLTSCGYVEQEGRGVYRVGVKLRRVEAVNRFRGPGFEGAVAKCLRGYVKEVGEACLLAVLVDGQRVEVGHVESDQTIQVAKESVMSRPLFELPTGRLLAGGASEAELGRVIERHGFPGEYWDGIEDRGELEKKLAVLRRRGWCEVVKGELVGWACMVKDDGGRCLGVVGSYGPGFRCGKGRRGELRKAPEALAERVGREVDWPGVGE